MYGYIHTYIVQTAGSPRPRRFLGEFRLPDGSPPGTTLEEKPNWRGRCGVSRPAGSDTVLRTRKTPQPACPKPCHVRRRCAPSLLCLTLPPPTVRCCRSPSARKEKTCRVELTNRRPCPRPLATARHCDARCAMCCTASHQGRGTGEGADQRATLNARDSTVVHAGVHQV